MASVVVGWANVKGVARRRLSCQSEAKEGRCPPLPLPSCSPWSSLWRWSECFRICCHKGVKQLGQIVRVGEELGIEGIKLV